MADFFKYSDSPTIYNSQNQAFSSAEDFFKAGGAKDFSNVQTLQGSTPDLLKSASVYTPQTISVDRLQPQQPINLPQPQQQPNTTQATVASAQQTSKTLADYIKELTPEPTQTQNQYDAILKRVNELLPQTTGQDAVLAQEQDKQGMTDLKKQLTDVNSQILSKSAELAKLDAELAQTTVDAEGKVQSMGKIRGAQAQAQRQAAVMKQSVAAEINALQARSAGLVGNLQLANELATKAAEAKFKPVQEELDIKLKQLSLIQPLLDKEEKIRSQALERQYQDQQRQIEDQKAATSFAIANDIQSPFYQVGGTIYRTSDGKPYTSPKEFFADGGALDFSGVQVINSANQQEKDLVVQYANKYPDAGITLKDSLGTAQQKIAKSRIYQDQVRGPVGSGGGKATGLAGTYIIDAATDAAVKSIIASRPGDHGYGDAYNAVKAKFGEQVANAYDKVYQSVFNGKATVDAAFNDAKLSSVGTGDTPKTTQPKLSAEIQKTLNTLGTVEQISDQILTLGERTGFAGTGGFGQGSVQQYLAKNLGKGTQEQEQLRNMIAQAKANIAALRAGTSFTANEEKLLDSYTPTINDSPLVIKSKLASLKQFTQAYRDQVLVNSGGAPATNTSNSNDPLGLF